MPRKHSIAPRSCKHLFEGVTPAAEETAQPFALPASFPAHCLDDDQLLEIENWFDTWAADLLHTLKQALLCARTRSTKADAAPPVNLQNLIIHSAVLAHLLRLHPSAEATLPELAKALGVSRSRVYYARDAILEQLGSAAIAAFRSTRAVRDITLDQLTHLTQLDLPGATRPAARVLLIPFAGYHGVAARFATVQHIATLPGVDTVREDITHDDRHAVRITLKS
jgi:hypothetical protein